MWKRSDLKIRARKVLSRSYRVSFLVAIVLFICGGTLLNSNATKIPVRYYSKFFNIKTNNVFTDIKDNVFNDIKTKFYNSGSNKNIDDVKTDFGTQNSVVQVNHNNIVSNNPTLLTTGLDFIINFFKTMFLILIVAFVITLLFRILVGYSATVGGYRFFLRSAQGIYENSRSLLEGFRSDRYMNILLTMLLRDVYIFLWSILLVVPGVIKLYSYRMVPYILAENPNISPKRVLEISEYMMNGEKMNTFYLDLSFLIWRILILICGIIGAFFLLPAIPIAKVFLVPYVHATDAQLYIVLRNEMINSGNISASELNLVPVKRNYN